MRETHQAEVNANFKAFQRMLPELLQRHRGRWALMRHGKCVECYDTLRDARLVGQRLYEDGMFSTQEVTNEIPYMGRYFRALP